MIATDRAPSPRRRRSSAASIPSSSIRSETTSSTANWSPVERPAAEPRQQHVHVGRAVVAAADRLLRQELDRRQRHVDALRGQPDDDGGARRDGARPTPGGSSRRLPTTSNAWSTPPPVSATISRVTPAPAGDRVRRAAATRELELRRLAVDGDDRRRPGQPCAGDHLQPDAAAADHADALADPHAGGVDGADPGDDATAEQRGLPQRELARDRHGAAAGSTAYSAKQATSSPC